ncbi:hypothetical protein M758_12G069600 [Ceratodon purpureus]|nr:hypothetical protein M758_12G069600 [Ceratodon purpureus]
MVALCGRNLWILLVDSLETFGIFLPCCCAGALRERDLLGGVVSLLEI